jgi:hypothetical protein
MKKMDEKIMNKNNKGENKELPIIFQITITIIIFQIKLYHLLLQ